MDAARKIASGDELRALATAGTGFIIDPFYRRWHHAACPHILAMTTGQPKWFARSPAALEDYQRQRLTQYPTAKVILPCATCSSQTRAQAGSSVRHQIAHVSADQAAQIRAALWQVISESEPAALCRPAQLASLLADLLPDQPGIQLSLRLA